MSDGTLRFRQIGGSFFKKLCEDTEPRSSEADGCGGKRLNGELKLSGLGAEGYSALVRARIFSQIPALVVQSEKKHATAVLNCLNENSRCSLHLSLGLRRICELWAEIAEFSSR